VTMVVAPPFAYLHHPSTQWQSLFALTTPARAKSVQNVADSDILATAASKLANSGSPVASFPQQSAGAISSE
jgi:hypothetical protein